MTTRLYKINGVYNTWQYWHDSCGYSESPSQPMSFKRSDGEHWGENAGDGYALNNDGELSQWSMWSDGIVGWFDANDLAEQGVYPASSADLFVERTGEKAKAVSLDDGTNTYYLIDGYLDLGWRLWEVLEAEGWHISSGGELAYIVVDEDTGEIVFSQNDPGMEFAEVGTLLMPDSEMLLIYNTGVANQAFFFTPSGRGASSDTSLEASTSYPLFDETGIAASEDNYPGYLGSNALAFVKADGNTYAASAGDKLNLGVHERLRLENTAAKDAWAVLVEKVSPSPAELTAYFTSAGAGSTSDTSVGRNSYYPLFDANGNRIPYDSTKLYVIVGVYQYDGAQVQASTDDFLSGPDGTGLMWFSNVLPSTGRFYYAYKLTYTVS